jgi:hypothetical protein
VKPNFMIIGAARSGTTSLYFYLDQHPEVSFSEIKELNFFSNPRYWSKGFEWYESRFQDKLTGSARIGEASTSYTRAPFVAKVPERIFEYDRNMKMIYIVRDPIERVISHYLHLVQAGQEVRSFSNIIENMENEPFVHQSLYSFQLNQYMKVFDKSQIFVCTMDELKENPDALVARIFRFLDVDPEFKVDGIQKVFNSNRETKRKASIGLFVLKYYKKYLEQRSFPFLLKNIIQRFANIGSIPVEKPIPSEQERRKMIGFFEGDLSELESEFGIDISGWIDNFQL